MRNHKPGERRGEGEGEGAGTPSSLSPHPDIHVRLAQSHHCPPTPIYIVLASVLVVSSWLSASSWQLGSLTVWAIALGEGVGLLRGQSCNPAIAGEIVSIELLIPQNKGPKAKGLRGQWGLSLLPKGF